MLQSSPGIGLCSERGVFRLWVLMGAVAALTATAPAQQLDWVRQFADLGTAGETFVTDVKVAGGFVYAVGNIVDPPTFDCFIHQYDLAGTLLWSEVFGTPDFDEVNVVSVVGTTVYVAGATSGTFPGETDVTLFMADPYLRSYDTNGVHIETIQIPRLSGSFNANPAPAFIDSSGMYGVDLVDVGFFDQDVQVFKYSLSGILQWSTTFGTSSPEQVASARPRPLTFDGTDIFVTGSTQGVFSGQVLTGFEDAFLARLDLAGNLSWVRQSGVVNWFSFGSGVAPDGAGGVYASSTSQSFSGDTILSVSRHNSLGGVLWTQELSSVDFDLMFASIDANASGVCVSGSTADLFFPGYTNAGAHDVFAHRFDASGNEVWTTMFGSSANDEAYAVALDGNETYIGGIARASLPGQVISNGAFLVKVLGPASVDTDGDGLSDSDEVVRGTNPLNPDTDADGSTDGAEVALAGGGSCPDPLDGDSDGDGLGDGHEINLLGTSPCLIDTDGDGLHDDFDPLPTIPGVTPGVVEAILLTFADLTTTIELGTFVGPNEASRTAKRNAIADKFRAAAESASVGDFVAVDSELRSLLKKLDPTKNGAWMVSSPEQADLYATVTALLAAL
jgi:Bacterial TSP3 repeat